VNIDFCVAFFFLKKKGNQEQTSGTKGRAF